MISIPPKEFRIFPKGQFTAHWLSGQEKVYLFDEVSAMTVMEQSKHKNADYSIDYEHQALSDPPEQAPAAGWFSLELREDGLYAVNVRWTEKAEEYLKNKEYRYFSPAFRADSETGRVVELANVALTNIPATQSAPALIEARAKEKKMLEICKALGLAEESEKEVILEKLASLSKEKEEAQVALSSVVEEKDNAIVALSAANKEKEDAIVALAAVNKEKEDAIIALKASAENMALLSERVNSLEAEKAQYEVERLINDNPKKITPAMKSWALSQKADALRAFLSVAPEVVQMNVVSGNESRVAGQKSWSQMSSVEKHNLFVDNRELYNAIKAEGK